MIWNCRGAFRFRFVSITSLDQLTGVRDEGTGRFFKGQMLVLFTLVLPVLLGVMALGADFSIIYFHWSIVQKAADAAALAGASQLTGVTGSAATVQAAAVNYVNGYACFNGIKNGTSTLCTAGASGAGYSDNIVFTNVRTPKFGGYQAPGPVLFRQDDRAPDSSGRRESDGGDQATRRRTEWNFPVGLQCTPTGSPASCNVASLYPGHNVTFGSNSS